MGQTLEANVRYEGWLDIQSLKVHKILASKANILKTCQVKVLKYSKLPHAKLKHPKWPKSKYDVSLMFSLPPSLP